MRPTDKHPTTHSLDHAGLNRLVSYKRISHLKNFVSMLKDDKGQGLVEYALIIALVSILAIAALKFLGGKASNTLNNAANALSN